MPLISLVIPTRDRDQTLRYTLQTATEQAFPDCEIVVSDAVGRPETQILVEEARRHDSRVRYVSPSARLGMSEHWEFALEQTRGDYVIYMGDDDGILPGALDTIAAEIERLGRPKILTWPQCTYMWPEVPDAFYPGLLSVPLAQAARIGDARRNLPHPPYRLFQMLTRTYPTIYNKSAFSRELIDQIRQDSGGTFFRSRIPDVYSGVVASVYVDRVPILGKPLMINAQSVRSNGIAFAQPAGKGDGEARSFLRESKIDIHPTAGGEMTSLLQVLWWETALQAHDAVGHARPFKLPDPRSVVKSALFAAQAIADDVNYDKEVSILRHIADVNDFLPAFDGWLGLTKRQPMKGRMQRTGYDLKTDAIFIDTIALGVRTIVDAVKVAATALELAAGMSKPGWRVRDSWRYYKDYVGKRLSVANVIRFVATRR